MKVIDYLTNEQVEFELIEHRDTYEAQRMAEEQQQTRVA